MYEYGMDGSIFGKPYKDLRPESFKWNNNDEGGVSRYGFNSAVIIEDKVDTEFYFDRRANLIMRLAINDTMSLDGADLCIRRVFFPRRRKHEENEKRMRVVDVSSEQKSRAEVLNVSGSGNRTDESYIFLKVRNCRHQCNEIPMSSCSIFGLRKMLTKLALSIP